VAWRVLRESVLVGSRGAMDDQPSPNAGVAIGPLSRRRARQRAAVLTLLKETQGFRTVREIHASLRERGEPVRLATLTRALGILVEQREVDVVRSDNGDCLFRSCGREHHHHLMCRSCGRAVEVRGPDVETWTQRIAEQHGFTDVGHSLEMIGRCSECAEQGH
jgi:Fur family ferric uptake transcriptional regulator